MERLLIVDDEPRLTRSFKVLFESKGFSVQTSSNGTGAIQLFKDSPFKVVILDIQMDDMNGIDVMRALKQIDPCVQIIFLTGYATIDNAAEALKQNNAFEYLKKPIKNMDEVYNIVHQAEKKYDLEKDRITRKETTEKEFAMFKDIFDSMEAIVYVADIKTHEMIYANHKFINTLGYDDLESVKGKKCWQIIQKDQTGPCPFCTNQRLLHPDGTPREPYEWEFQNTLNHRWYSIVDKAIEWYDKRIVRLETALDITEKKEHEKLFREFEKAIETTRKLEGIATLAGGVAHDFNNTLSTVIGNINLAQFSCPDTETQKYLQKAENYVMQAKSITSKLITFARGGGPFKAEVNIEKMIRQILEQTLDTENITWSFESDALPGTFFVDPDQIKTVISNILQNAIEAMSGKGRIDVALKYLEPSLKNPRICISISDSGEGISSEHLDMIFNPYFTTKPLNNQKSTGLGLSIAWSVISRHGGNIHVESTKRQGTTVHIFLPVFNEKITHKKSGLFSLPHTPPVSNHPRMKILVMDDDALTLDVISQLLKRMGYDTIVTSDGDRTVQVCREAVASGKKFNIAILDYDMKNGMGGIPVMAQLVETDPDIKGILITGHAENTDVRNFEKFGFSGMLEKPFSINQLNQKIRAILA